MHTKHFFRIFSISLIIITSNFAGENKVKINENLEIVQISETCFIHISYADIAGFPHFPSNGLIVVDSNQAILIDTPWDTTLTEQLVEYMTESMKLTIESVIVTHWHDDRMVGLEKLHETGVKSFASSQTIEICKGNQLPVPQNSFSDSLTLKLNDKTIRAFYLGAGHTMDNIFVKVPDEHIVFGGCAVKSAASKGLGYIADGDLNQWPATLNKALSKFKNSKIIVPGHGGYGDLGLIRHTLELLEANQKKASQNP